jgi:hypothetical protein
MNTNERGKPGAMNINDRDFDATLRGHHAQALASMSPSTQAQLQLRRRAATEPARHSAMHAFAWPLAAAFAASVLVVGLQWRQPDTSLRTAASPVAAPPGTMDATSKPENDEFDAYTALDETPDLYLWLASSDAATLAME